MREHFLFYYSFFLCVAAAAAQDEGRREVHLGVVHCARKCHCKLLIQMTATLADGSVLEADGDLLVFFFWSSFFFFNPACTSRSSFFL